MPYSFSGLRGNKLDIKAVIKLQSLLEEPENFRALVWADFRNNKGIITVPGEFVQLLTRGRTKHQASEETTDEKLGISVQDAINGKVV